MADAEVHVEQLLGRRVFAMNGRSIGRIEEVVASFDDGDCRVDEFHVGGYAWLERLAAWHLGRSVLRALGLGRESYRIDWRQIDLTDPERPRLRCTVDALVRLR